MRAAGIDDGHHFPFDVDPRCLRRGDLDLVVAEGGTTAGNSTSL
jgi:hypothetical protein